MCGRKGMKIGSRHLWHYTTERWQERKIAPKTWKFQYIQGKTRHTPAPYGTGMPTGSKLVWNIHAKQYAIKTGTNHYKLIMRGIKTQGAFKLPHQRWITNKKNRMKIW